MASFEEPIVISSEGGDSKTDFDFERDLMETTRQSLLGSNNCDCSGDRGSKEVSYFVCVARRVWWTMVPLKRVKV